MEALFLSLNPNILSTPFHNITSYLQEPTNPLTFSKAVRVLYSQRPGLTNEINRQCNTADHQVCIASKLPKSERPPSHYSITHKPPSEYLKSRTNPLHLKSTSHPSHQISGIPYHTIAATIPDPRSHPLQSNCTNPLPLEYQKSTQHQRSTHTTPPLPIRNFKTPIPILHSYSITFYSNPPFKFFLKPKHNLIHNLLPLVSSIPSHLPPSLPTHIQTMYEIHRKASTELHRISSNCEIRQGENFLRHNLCVLTDVGYIARHYQNVPIGNVYGCGRGAILHSRLEWWCRMAISDLARRAKTSTTAISYSCLAPALPDFCHV